uniref:N-acetylgalactosaminide beta-1,3-galactosyltransferase n=1 Tax=Rhabditophanes sp. KR3021 TaxID=114890 RepID=A0AC35THZ7_9BILA
MAVHLLKRCNNYLVASSKADKSIKAIKAYKHDSYKYVWAKAKAAFKYIYKRYGTGYDWIIKCDDDSYVVLENLRMFLLNKDPNTHHYYGFRLQFYEPHTKSNYDYIQGGSCFVISKATLKTLVTKGLSNPKICKSAPEGHDDREIGHCLSKLAIKPVDVRDMHDQIMFIPSSPDEFATTDYNMNQAIFKAFNKVIIRDGKEGLSEYPIAFHYIEGNMQYGLEYLFYKAQVIGFQQTLYKEICVGNCVNQTKTVMDKIRTFSSKLSKKD